ncbi:hypothetical protein V6N12_059896 [Hibiscus sabdariffa]|uniref:Uncharacterized protein n=1 Tax=Hibiscus sabdariffa TaxID=183260 RepID=A0ABR2D4L9_9ROSI
MWGEGITEFSRKWNNGDELILFEPITAKCDDLATKIERKKVGLFKWRGKWRQCTYGRGDVAKVLPFHDEEG